MPLVFYGWRFNVPATLKGQADVADINGFFAYPAVPHAIGSTIEAALKALRDRSGITGLSSWREADIAGRFIRTEILQQIAEWA